MKKCFVNSKAPKKHYSTNSIILKNINQPMFKHLRLSYLTFLILSISIPSIAQSLESKIQTLLDSTMAANPEAIGIMLHVEAPDHSLSFTGSAGSSEQGKNQPINPLQPALIASNTKTMVAATIVRLAEQKKLELDQAIGFLLSEQTRSAMTAKGYPIETITLRQLLSHTSGIIDYVNDAYFDTVHHQPQKQWTREEQIDLAMSVTDLPDEPGKAYSYGDINYLLATEIIEGLTDKPFWQAVRELLRFEELGIKHMWFYNLEEYPEGALPLVHQYWGERNWDSYNLNPSWDLYGGGGQASTAKDLALFFQHLFNGKIIQDTTLLKSMHTYVLPKEQSIYCLGLRKINFHGNEAYYHGGFWGTDVMYLPELNMTIAAFTLLKEKRILNAQLSKQILKLFR